MELSNTEGGSLSIPNGVQRLGNLILGDLPLLSEAFRKPLHLAEIWVETIKVPRIFGLLDIGPA